LKELRFSASSVFVLLLVVTLGVWIMASAVIPRGDEASYIGGTQVPHLHCQEDEVIYFSGVDTLACRHIETIHLGLR